MLPKYKFTDIDYEIKLVQLYMMALALQICPMRQKYQGKKKKKSIRVSVWMAGWGTGDKSV